MAEDNVREAVRLGLKIKRETEAKKAARKQASATIAAPKAAGVLLTKAEEDILKERSRQVMQEGWDAAHDDEHSNDEIAMAAACYALNDTANWPWSMGWWKPTDRRRDLVKAGALIIAEIERLDRLASHPNLSSAEERANMDETK